MKNNTITIKTVKGTRVIEYNPIVVIAVILLVLFLVALWT